MVSVTLTAADIPGADLSELLVLFWHRYLPGTSSRLRPQLPAIHPKHAEPSRSRTWIAWKSVEEGARILAWVVATTRYRYVQHTALFSFVLQPILTLCTPSLPPVKHHSHMNCVICMVLVTRRFPKPPPANRPYSAKMKFQVSVAMTTTTPCTHWSPCR